VALFKVTFQVERTEPARVELVGRVYNTAAVDAVDVYVTAEALDASGKVLARGIAFAEKFGEPSGSRTLDPLIKRSVRGSFFSTTGAGR